MALQACASFQGDDGLALLDNSCSSDSQCGTGERCVERICVQRSSDEQNVILQITPEFMPDGSESVPLFADLSRIDGATTRNVELRLSVPVRMRLRRDGVPIAGELRISPVSGLPGLSPRIQTVADPNAVDEEVTLPDQAMFVVRGVPSDRSLPPLEVQITVSKGMRVDLDVDVAMSKQFAFTGLPMGAAMQVTARSEGGPRLSSAVVIDGDRATLEFASEVESFVLDVTPTANTTTDKPSCGQPGSLVPSFRVPSTALSEGDDGVLSAVLPSTLPSIDYGGHVELCDESGLTAEAIDSLSISLRSTALASPDGTAASAEAYYQGDERVTYDVGSGRLQFCIPTLPGTFEVVVNAPPTLGTCVKVQDAVRCGCGIFAEERLIQAPPNSNAQLGAALQLPTMASLSGALSADGKPVMGASIEAVAQGVSTGIELGADDRGLTAYNRSRQATSDGDGSFRLPLDVGAYDVTIKPVADSGFAWAVVRDVLIANRSQEFVQQFSLSAPVSVSGALQYRDGDSSENASLAGAVIRAYQVVTSDDRIDRRRTIALGQALADEQGRFTLLLPASVRTGWY